jgi:hypothetical protein
MSNINCPVQCDCDNMTNAVGTSDTSKTDGLTHYALEVKINLILDALKAAGIIQDK